MDIAVVFYIQVILCIATFASIYYLMQSTHKLKKVLDKKSDKD